MTGAARDAPIRALDEFESKALLRDYGIPCVAEALATTVDEAVAAAANIGYPVALKGCGPEFLHKTDLGLVCLGIASDADAGAAARQLLAAMQGCGRLLVQAMASGKREFLIGMTRDEQFGPAVTFGLGGIFAEALADVAMRIAPFDEAQALAMVDEIRAARLLGEVRGMPAVDRAALARALVAVGRLALERPDIREIDINPLVIAGADPVAVDALIVLEGHGLRA